jgi:hypothetical protein
MRRSVAVLPIVATMIAVAAMMPGAAVAATPEAAWTITAVPYPSTFEAGSVDGSIEADGPAYLIQAYNAGAKPTSGTFTLTDTLPAGLLPAPGVPPTGVYGPQLQEISPGIHAMSCSTLVRKVTCTGGAEGPVGPGESVTVIVPVEVQANAAEKAALSGGFLTDQATIEGGGAAAAVSNAQPTPVIAHGASGQSPFGFLPEPAGLHGETTLADGSPATQAGSHPYSMTVAGLNLATNPSDVNLLAAGGGLRDATVTLPKGTVIDPAATTKCKESELETELKSGANGCPDASQVGTIVLTLSITTGFGKGPIAHAVYNMVVPPGSPAELGFEVISGTYVHLLGKVSSDGTFTLTANSKDILARAAIGGVRTTLWGVPSEEAHDRQRGECLYKPELAGCTTTRTGKPFVTLPSACSGPLVTSVHATSWLGETADGSYESTDLAGNPVGVEGCGALVFEPKVEAGLTTGQGDSPSGLDLDLRQPQHEDASELATANLKDTTIVLPKGVAVNPSASNGLEACSSAQVGLASVIGAVPVRFQEGAAHCSDASKLGTVEVTTPLLKDGPEGEQVPHVLKGGVYLAKQFDNPFGSLLALYIVVEDEQTGIIAKLAGSIEANPVTGQLTTTFDENPELPLEDIKIHLFSGEHGALTTPVQCGEHALSSTLLPWSEGAAAHPSASLATIGSCSASEAAGPEAFSFSAGAGSSLAGAFSPFVVQISRPDGSQRLGALDLTLPEGLLGKIAGVPYCSDAQIAQAQARSHPEEGKLEQAAPSCPVASEVGAVTVGAGSGPDPVYVSGHAYLAGPYKGAPLSLAIITPAIAGPFDLGTVVVRVALNIDANTAQIHAVSDPIPSILDGIPLDVRSVSLNMNRAGFTFNPTSCEALSVTGQAISTLGQATALSNRFQVGGCQNLPFKPSLTASTVGKASKANGASLTVKVAQKPGEANIHKVALTLPTTLPARLTTLQKACTEAQFNTNPAGCPAGSFIGTAKAVTPILSVPLVGPAIIVSHGGAAFPDVEFLLQADERGSVIQIDLDGKTDIKKGVTYSRFEMVPDAPISSFETSLTQGPHSILGVNLPASAKYSLCGQKLSIPTTIAGQNGTQTTQATPLSVTGCSTAVSFTHTVKKRTLTLTVYAPAAGKITATGKGLTTQAKTAKGQENLTITLKQKKAGKQNTTVRVAFTPTTGKDRKKQSKTAKLRFKQ